MAYLKYIVPVLAAGHLAFADSVCNSTETIKIQNAGDAGALASCSSVGSIEISEHYSGDLTLNGLQKITGDLKCSGASNMTSLSAPQLSSIGDTFQLNGLTQLTSLSFGSLKSVGAIDFEALPVLQTLAFATGVSSAGHVRIANTGLTTLEGISLDTVGDFDITDNPNLKTVNVNELKKCTGLINFAGNYKSLSIELPNLATGTNMTFRNVSSVSIPSLHNLTGQLGFWGDDFKSFSAPNLTQTGDLVFDGNEALSNVTMPALETVKGGFLLARNDELKDISFPSLATITGALDFSGVFEHVSLPALKDVKGGFNMQSTGNFSCDPYQSLRDKHVIAGSYKCTGTEAHPTTKDGSSGTSTSSGSSSSSASASSTNAASMANVANMPVMGMAAVFGALLQYAL